MTDFTVDTTADETYDGGDLAAETADGGGLSLREALALANANADADTVGFDAGLEGQTLVLTNGELAIAQDVSISGDTDDDHKADITISGNDASRILNITGGDVALASLTLTDGAVSGAASAGRGGAIFSNGTTLTIQDSTIRDSSAQQGGGIFSHFFEHDHHQFAGDRQYIGNRRWRHFSVHPWLCDTGQHDALR